MKAISIDRAIGVYIDSSAGGMDWFVMLISNDERVWTNHVVPQGPQAPLTLISAFAADYIEKAN